jgi:hypothetical protein
MNAYKMTDFLHIASKSPFASPHGMTKYEANADFDIPIAPFVSYTEIKLLPGDVSCYGIFGSFVDEDFDPLTLSDAFEYSIMANSVHEILMRYSYSKKVLNMKSEPLFDLPGVMFTKKDRFDYAFSPEGREYLMPRSLELELMNEFMERQNIGAIIPEVLAKDIRLDVRDEVRARIRLNPAVFGFLDRVVMCDTATQYSTAQGRRFYCYDPKKPGEFYFLTGDFEQRPTVLSLGKIYELTRDGQYYKTIADLVKRRKPIVFEMPVKIDKLNKFFETIDVSDNFPVDPATNLNNILELRSISLFFDILAEYNYVKFWKPKLSRLPRFVPHIDDILRIDPVKPPLKTLLSMPRMVVRPTSHIKFFKTEELFQRAQFIK